MKPLPPGGAPPRLPDGHIDFSGHWLPNGAGQGVSGRFGVDPAARGQFDPEGHAGGAPVVPAVGGREDQVDVARRSSSFAKSSVNCMPRGLPAIWLQNPYSTVIVHTPKMMAQLYEVLNNWRLVHFDGRPVPKNPEPWFHGTPNPRWEGDTLVDRVDRVRRPDVHHAQRVVPQRGPEGHRALQPAVDELPDRRRSPLTIRRCWSEPWTSAPRRWTLGNGEVYEFYCTNNKEIEELEKLKDQEAGK